MSLLVALLRLPAPSEARFKWTSGSLDELTLYQFHKKVYKHYFCAMCGCQVVLQKEGEDKMHVNLRGVDGVDVRKLRFVSFNGKAL